MIPGVTKTWNHCSHILDTYSWFPDFFFSLRKSAFQQCTLNTDYKTAKLAMNTILSF